MKVRRLARPVDMAQTQTLRHWATCDLGTDSALRPLLRGRSLYTRSQPIDQPTPWIDVALTCALLTRIRSSTNTANRRLHLSFVWVLQFGRPLNRASAQTSHATPATYFLPTPYQQDDAPLHYFVLHFLCKGARVPFLPNGTYSRTPGSAIPRLSAQTAPLPHSANCCAAVPLHSTPPMPYAFTASFHRCAFCPTTNAPAKRTKCRTSYIMIQNQTNINCTHFFGGSACQATGLCADF